MESSFFSFLPDEIILLIALYLPLSSISYFCQTNPRFNHIICDNEDFWRDRFFQDFGFVDYDGDWKQLYMGYMNVWTFGSNKYGQLGLNDKRNRNLPTQI